MGDVIIRGGTVVDGTGAPGFTADVRVRDGLIAEVGPGLAVDGEQEIDAGGAYVIPGIIDNHTHLDGAMWWDADLDPLPASGNTSMVFGNCGNSIAPLAGDQRDEIVDLLCFLEDLPLEAFERLVPVDLGAVARLRRRPRGPAHLRARRRLRRPPRAAHLRDGPRRVGARRHPRRGAAHVRRARRGPGRRRPRPVAQLLRPRPHPAPRARLLRRRRRAARPVPGRGPPPPGHRAVHHPVQRPRARRRRRRAHGPPPEGRGRRAGPVARHPHERARRRPPARPVGRPPPHPGRRRRPVAGRGVQAPRPVLQLRALDRVPAGAGVERVGQRPGRRPSWPPSPTRPGATGPAPTGTTAPARRSPASTARTR